MSRGEYVTGVVLLGVILAAVGIASELLRRRRLADLRGIDRVLAQALLVTVGLAAVHLVPLALGILGRGSVLVAALVLAAAAALLPARPPATPDPAPEPLVESGRLAWALAVGAAAIAGALLAVGFVHAAGGPTEAPDLVSFDLPIVAQWIQTGSAWQITELFTLQTHGTYPHNAHLVLLAAILPFDNDGLVRFAVYPFLVLAALGVYGLACQLRAPRAAAAAFAAMLAAIPVVATTVEFAPLDVIGVAMFATGLSFLARAARTERVSDLVLAGLGLGFAVGAKWYTASAAAAVLVVWAGSGLVARRGWRPVLRDLALVGGVAALAGGFWLVRNLVEAGDPLYPQPVRALGVTIFDAPPDLYRELVGFSLAHYIGDWSVWRHYVLPDFRDTFALGGALAAAGALVALVMALARRPGLDARGGWIVPALGACVPVLVGLYLVTPYTGFGFEGAPALASANTRYAIPALLVAAALCAWLAGWGGPALVGLCAAALAGAIQGVWVAAGDLHVSRPAVAGVAAAFAALAAFAWIARAGLPRPGRAPALAAAAAAAAAVVVAGYVVERKVNDDRYGGVDPTYDWVRAHAPSGTRIGLTGYFDFSSLAPAWPLTGRRLENRLAYVGRIDGGRVEQYGSRAAWERAVRRGRYDLLLVARARSPFPGGADEPRWAADTPGWSAVAESPSFVLYRRRG